MANILKNYLDNLADAIRTKTEGTAIILSVSCGGNAIRYSCAVLIY